MKTEEPALVQELLVLAQQHARVLGLGGTLTQDGHDLPHPPHRLVVADGGEIATLRLRQRADDIAAIAGTSHDHLPQTIALPTGSAARCFPVQGVSPADAAEHIGIPFAGMRPESVRGR